jgi:hypothetical protein
MLRKLVLLVVALFSIATEMRMLVQFGKKETTLKKDDFMRWSELWHAQSVFFGAYFLPQTCPLVTHVANSYNKHYIAAKPSKPPVLKPVVTVTKAKARDSRSSDNNVSSDGEQAMHQVINDYTRSKQTVSIANMRPNAGPKTASESSVSPIRCEIPEAKKEATRMFSTNASRQTKVIAGVQVFHPPQVLLQHSFEAMSGPPKRHLGT